MAMFFEAQGFSLCARSVKMGSTGVFNTPTPGLIKGQILVTDRLSEYAVDEKESS